MFRRLWKGLPSDPEFPDDLGQLGYYINEEDEIRNIENPKYYFKYFINKNMHWNDRQRFAFNTATRRIVLERLKKNGLRRVRLPPNAADSEPHLNILVTGDLLTAQRVILFVGETAQDLGILAHRVVSGAGGINMGSLLPMVQALRPGYVVKSGPDLHPRDPYYRQEAPAIVICNPGELFWWPEGRRALSLPMSQGIPGPSAAHLPPRKVPERNSIPGHGDADEHIASVFRDVLSIRLRAAGGPPRTEPPRIQAIGLAGGADALERFLDQDDVWARWGPCMESLTVLGGLFEERDIRTDSFRKFLRERGRAYMASNAPVNAPIAGADGNENSVRTTRYGCPVFSSGRSWLTEMMFIDAMGPVLAWGEMVGRNRDYVNPAIEITYEDTGTGAAGGDGNGWNDYDEGTFEGWEAGGETENNGDDNGEEANSAIKKDSPPPKPCTMEEIKAKLTALRLSRD